MKVILSRKGFDSSNGGIVSPIFDDGSMVSFPIPTKDKDQLAHLLDEFNDKYPLDDGYYNILAKIFYKLDECGVVNEKET